MGKEHSTERLLNLIEEATSPFHTVLAVKKELVGAGFIETELGKQTAFRRGGRYVMTHGDSNLFAFTIGEEFQPDDGIRIAAAHVDFPGFRIKPNPDMLNESYLRLNTERYGGVNLASWLDRPLSVAGRVMLRSDDIFQPTVRFVDFKKPILTIPGIAIHLQNDLNKGMELNLQTNMLPIFSIAGGEIPKDFFLTSLANELEVQKEDILDYELQVYNTDPGDYVGYEEELLSAPRLDNITGTLSVVEGLLESERSVGINLGLLFDHEEVGSQTAYGAKSSLLRLVLEKIYTGLSLSTTDLVSSIPHSMLISVDTGHGYHPGFLDKNDPTNPVILNRGLVLKEACVQSYATDGEGTGIIMQLCEKEGISYQRAVNRSDIRGGQTLGPILCSSFPVRAVDLGVPLLSMHSARELMGKNDYEELIRMMKAYFNA